MSVFRIKKEDNYTVMGKYHLNERGMSLKAKGLLSLMLSLPPDWDYSVRGLVALSKDGTESVMNTLDELEKFGYLRRSQAIDKKGRFAGYDYDIYEQPQTGKPCTGNPNTDEPNTENPAQLNNKINTSYNKKINNSLYKGEGNSKNPKEITDLFNSTCPSLPAVKYMTENRREAIAKALETFTVEQLQQCFQIAEESPFLTGKNERAWKATFDWLINPENVAKVLEDNYPGEAPANAKEQPPASFNTEEFFSAALDRAYSAK